MRDADLYILDIYIVYHVIKGQGQEWSESIFDQ